MKPIARAGLTSGFTIGFVAVLTVTLNVVEVLSSRLFVALTVTVADPPLPQTGISVTTELSTVAITFALSALDVDTVYVRPSPVASLNAAWAPAVLAFTSARSTVLASPSASSFGAVMALSTSGVVLDTTVTVKECDADWAKRN